MLRKIIKQIIVHNQERILTLPVKRRDVTLNANANYIITGSRRAGKTYLLYQYIQSNFNRETIKRVLFINFEDERLLELNHKNFQLILDSYYELFDGKPVLFFDEIQNVKYWEKFVRRLADDDYKIMITGSNSTMLSNQMASVLGGRFFIKEIMPLSFREFLHFHDLEIKENFQYAHIAKDIKRLFFEYFKYGGFPELIKFDDKRSYLSNLFHKLFYGDIIARYSIKNDTGLKLIIKKMGESVNNETSVNRIKNLIKSIGISVGTSTVFEYLAYLEEAYLLFSIKNHVNKFVERESKKKYYFIDNGILTLFIHDQDTKLLENLVFLELKRRYGEVDFYKRNVETDFYIPEKNLLIQVTYAISDIETEKREVKALEKSITELNGEKALIITFDTEKQLKIANKIIPVIPVWKWLLSNI